MKITTLLLLFTGLLLSSCIDGPKFSETPKIELEDISFKRKANINSEDSLSVLLSFEDGDGDLGLGDQFTSPPYNAFNFFTDNSGQLLTKDYIGLQGFDFLPPYSYPERCKHWLDGISTENFKTLAGIEFNSPTDELQTYLNLGLSLDTINNIPQILDTIYFEANPDHENMVLDILILDPNGSDYQDGDGSYRVFDWVEDITTVTCGSRQVLRFPVLGDLNDQSPLEGTLKYSFHSPVLEAVFKDYTMKLRIRIKDRALNESNEIVTELFTLNDKLVN